MKQGKIGLLFAALCAMAGMAAAQVEMEDTTKVDIAPPPSAGPSPPRSSPSSTSCRQRAAWSGTSEGGGRCR